MSNPTTAPDPKPPVQEEQTETTAAPPEGVKESDNAAAAVATPSAPADPLAAPAGPVAAPAGPVAAPAGPVAAPAGDLPSDTSAPSTDPAATGESAATGGEEEAKPSDRLRIGTQRGGEAEPTDGDAPQEEALKPKPVNPVTVSESSETKPTKYPPPNVRAQLSPEQEAELEAAMSGESIDALIDQSAATVAEELAPESKVKGRVTNLHGDSVFVDLGSHRQGAVPLKQFDPESPDKAPPEVGAELDLLVVKLNAEEGLYELALPTAAVEVGNWDDVKEGQVVEVSVTGVNKGGLECQAAGIRAFMPMGQISLYRVDKPEDYVGQRLTAVVTEANRERRNLVLSHRAVMERERAAKRDELLKELAPGQMREGVVRNLRDFGAFVDLGGVDGLIHVSKMSWDRVNHPSEVLKEGQAVKVKIERIDPETGKIGLSYRESAENPWDSVDAKYPVGGRASGVVTKIMDFGAFVKLEPGIEGLIHISELAHGRVFRTGDAVSEGQQLEIKILSVDREKQRIALSLKALMAAPAKPDDDKQEEDFTPPPDAPKPPKQKAKNLKGGIGGPSGGEQFGLKW